MSSIPFDFKIRIVSLLNVIFESIDFYSMRLVPRS